MRVLICDDNRDIADTLRIVFIDERHEVAVCYDGIAGVDKAREWKPHVGVMDIGMPGMTGYAVAKAIRAMDFGQDVLLIAISGYGRREDREMSADSGFDFHFHKPFEARKLLRLISDHRSSISARP